MMNCSEVGFVVMCSVVSCYVTLCCVVLCCVVLCFVVLCCVVLCCAVQCVRVPDGSEQNTYSKNVRAKHERDWNADSRSLTEYRNRRRK